MSRRKDKRIEARDPVSRDLMTRSEGRKEWLDSYDLISWGAEPIVWLIFVIIAVVLPVPVVVFFGSLPFFIVTPISWALAALGAYMQVRRLEQDAEERDKAQSQSRPAR